MHVKMKCTVEWDGGSYQTEHGVRGVSRKHALDKMVKAIMQWPCFKDRDDAGLRVSAGASILAIDGVEEK